MLFLDIFLKSPIFKLKFSISDILHYSIVFKCNKEIKYLIINAFNFIPKYFLKAITKLTKTY